MSPTRSVDRASAIGPWFWGRLSGPSGRTLLTSILSQAFTLVTGVVAARALGVDGRGELAILWITPLALVMIGGLGLPQATAYFAARKGTKSGQKAVVKTALRLALPVVIFLGGGYLVAALLLTSPDSELREAALVSVSLVPLVLFQTIGVMTLQGLQRFDLYNLTRVLPVAIYAAGATALFLLDLASLTALVAVNALGLGLALIFTWTQVSKHLRTGAGGAVFPPGKLLSFGARGMLGDVNPVEDTRADQLIVGYLVGARGLGLYASSASFTNAPRFITQALGAVAFPRIASSRDREAQWALIRRAAKIALVAVVATVGLIELALPFLVEFLFGREFLGAVPIGRILLIAGGLFAMKRLMTDLIRGLGNPGYSSLAEIINLGVFALGVGVMATVGSLTALDASLAVLGGERRELGIPDPCTASNQTSRRNREREAIGCLRDLQKSPSTLTDERNGQ